MLPPHPPGNAVDQQLVEEIKRMNCGIAKGKEDRVEGCEGLYQSVSPQQTSPFLEIRIQREGKKEKMEQVRERGAKEEAEEENRA